MVMLPKLPFMNGVQILGINWSGVDNIDYKEDKEDEEDKCVYDTEEDTSRESDGVVHHFEKMKDKLKRTGGKFVKEAIVFL